MTLRGKIGEVVEAREDGRVSVRFEGGRLFDGPGPRKFRAACRVGAEGKEMTLGEAKLRLLAEWRTWIGHQQAADGHTAIEASNFVAYIEQNHADLFSFESSDDKMTVVKEWLLDAGLIK